MTSAPPAELSPLEVASGTVLGFAPPRREPPVAEDGSPPPPPPREALEQAILPALLRPPCLMSFSGGRGSSVVLALAVELARRERLELPVPVTRRLARWPGVQETTCQERLIVRLGLTEWLRLEFDDELDVVGPVATAALRRQGTLWPAHAHSWIPLIEWASGGSLLTGVGGNDFAEPALRANDVQPLPWLVPAAEAEVRSRWISDAALRRQAARRQLGWWLRLRQSELALDLLRRLAREHRVLLCHPLVDPAFTAALSPLPGARRSLARLLDDVVPPEVLGPPIRRSPATALWGSHSVRLAAGWQRDGVDPALVDAERLRREWSRPRPDPRTFLLLQSVAVAHRSSASAKASARG